MYLSITITSIVQIFYKPHSTLPSVQDDKNSRKSEWMDRPQLHQGNFPICTKYFISSSIYLQFIPLKANSFFISGIYRRITNLLHPFFAAVSSFVSILVHIQSHTFKRCPSCMSLCVKSHTHTCVSFYFYFQPSFKILQCRAIILFLLTELEKECVFLFIFRTSSSLTLPFSSFFLLYINFFLSSQIPTLAHFFLIFSLLQINRCL